MVPMWRYAEFNLFFGPKTVLTRIGSQEPFVPNTKVVPEAGLSSRHLRRVRSCAPFEEGVSHALETYLRRILALAEKHDVGVLMVLAPEYGEWAALLKNRGRIIRRYESIAREFAVPCFVPQAGCLLDDPELFYDPKHLNQHIDYGQLHTDPGATSADHAAIDAQNQHSLATPLQPVVSSDGLTMYVAAFGSGKIGVFDTADIEVDGDFERYSTTFKPAERDLPIRMLGVISHSKFLTERLILNPESFYPLRSAAIHFRDFRDRFLGVFRS
jgi:hypothetical protein